MRRDQLLVAPHIDHPLSSRHLALVRRSANNNPYLDEAFSPSAFRPLSTLPELPGLEQDGSYGEVAMEKTDWKLRNKDYVKQILQYRPEAVYVEGDVFSAYPVVHLLRKKHVPVLAMAERGGERILVRIPSGS